MIRLRVPPSDLLKPNPPRFLVPGKLAKLQAARRRWAERSRKLAAAPAVLLVGLVLVLAGCSTEARSSARYCGTIGGQAVDVVEVSATSTTAGPDLAQAVAAAVAGLRGDVAGLTEAIKATPPPQPAIPAPELAKAVWKAAPPAAPPPAPPATVTGSGMGDTLLGTLAAYLTGRGGIHVAGRIRRRKQAVA